MKAPSRRTLLLLLALSVAAGLREGRELATIAGWNGRIASATASAEDGPAPPEVQFARAVELAARGDLHAALAAYRAIDPAQAPALALAARYNAANLLMAQAAALDPKAAPGQRLPLIELAKEGYREVLRADPEHWDARYNLERAQRLLPDPERFDEEQAEPRPGAERAVTTMRGYSPGLP